MWAMWMIPVRLMNENDMTEISRAVLDDDDDGNGMKKIKSGANW